MFSTNTRPHDTYFWRVKGCHITCGSAADVTRISRSWARCSLPLSDDPKRRRLGKMLIEVNWLHNTAPGYTLRIICDLTPNRKSLFVESRGAQNAVV